MGSGWFAGCQNDTVPYVICVLFGAFPLSDLVEHVWDPLSTTETSRLVNLTQRLFRDYPMVSFKSKATQVCLSLHLVLVWELRSFSTVSRCWELTAVKWDQVYNKKGHGRDLNYQ